jgi:hypothetical protein
MRKVIVLFSIFFFGLILFDLQNKIIEPLCVVKSIDSEKTYTDCQKTTVYENKERSNELKNKLNALLTNLKSSENLIGSNSKTIFTNASNIDKLKKVANGEDTNKDAACAKYPEAC